MREKDRTPPWFPIVTVLVLAPAMGELLSGSAPPAEYFQLVTLIFLILLYGTGALVIRETVQRWRGGWLAVLLLGFAYGIFEEGIVVHSFFDPTWMDIGLLASYGRWAGINWVWTIALTIFHGVVSISIPIALTELLIPQARNAHWLSRRGYIFAIVLFFLNSLLAPLFVQQYAMPGYLVSAAAMVLLFFAARKLSNMKDGVTGDNSVKNGPIIIFGFLMMAAMIAGMWILPSLSIPWLLTFLFLCTLPWFAVSWLWRKGIDAWGVVKRWSLCFGLTLPWLLLAVISEMDNSNRPDDTSGMILTTLVFTVFFFGLRFVIGNREYVMSEKHKIITTG